jgi:hypothetical protein
VIDDHVSIRCLTVPGTGKGLNVSVQIDDRISLFQPDVTVSYGAPSILAYSGPGSAGAFTRGDQVGRVVWPLGRWCSWCSLCLSVSTLSSCYECYVWPRAPCHAVPTQRELFLGVRVRFVVV